MEVNSDRYGWKNAKRRYFRVVRYASLKFNPHGFITLSTLQMFTDQCGPSLHTPPIYRFTHKLVVKKLVVEKNIMLARKIHKCSNHRGKKLLVVRKMFKVKKNTQKWWTKSNLSDAISLKFTNVQFFGDGSFKTAISNLSLGDCYLLDKCFPPPP